MRYLGNVIQPRKSWLIPRVEGKPPGEQPMPKAVIFDVDGTLVDSVDQHAHAWQDAFHDFGYDIPFQAIRGQIGKGGDQLIPVFLPKDKLDQQTEALEQHRGKLFKDIYLPTVTSFPAVRELFERLQRNNRQIALASSAKEDELRIYKQIARIEDLVQTHTSSDDAEKSKPYPDIFEAALQRLPGVHAHEVIVIGDTPYDAQAAAKAGIKTIGVLSGGFAEQDLRQAGCIAIYKDPADLLANYDTSPLAER
jgi:HAD superfamily hydrolase (TIGR01549 family)